MVSVSCVGRRKMSLPYRITQLIRRGAAVEIVAVFAPRPRFDPRTTSRPGSSQLRARMDLVHQDRR